MHESIGNFRQRFGDARLRARPIGAAHLGKSRRLPFRGRILRDLVHLRDRHEHAVRTGVGEIEIILRCAEDRFGAQAEILSDAVHRVHDVVADAQVGQCDRHAFFDCAKFDALGWSAEDLAIAEHAQAQIRDRKPGFNRTVIDRDAIVGNARCTQQIGGTRDRAADDVQRFARSNPLARALREKLDLSIEVLDRTALDHVRRAWTRDPVPRRGVRLRRARAASDAHASAVLNLQAADAVRRRRRATRRRLPNH